MMQMNEKNELNTQPRISLSELVKRYGLYHPSLSPDSLKLYGYAVRSLESHYGRTVYAEEFCDDLILPWMAWRLGVRTAKTVRRERSDLLTLWRFAFSKRLVPIQPIDVPKVKLPRHNPNSWTLEEYKRIIETTKHLTGQMRGLDVSMADWWHGLMVFLYWTGCRIDAALSVKVSDVNLRRRVVKLRAEDSKTRCEQVLSLHDQAIEAMKPLMKLGNDRVFYWPYAEREIFTSYKKILRAAGLPDDRYHMFQCVRRTTYTQCVKRGSKDIASKQLGHRTDMSRYYLDESQLEIPEAAMVLSPI